MGQCKNKSDFCFHCRDDSSEPAPSTSSELVDNRVPTQEGKQASQKSASTSKRPRCNQALVKNVDYHGMEEPKHEDTKIGAIMLGLHRILQ